MAAAAVTAEPLLLVMLPARLSTPPPPLLTPDRESVGTAGWPLEGCAAAASLLEGAGSSRRSTSALPLLPLVLSGVRKSLEVSSSCSTLLAVSSFHFFSNSCTNPADSRVSS